MGLFLILALAEGYLRLSPPTDLFPYLGEDSPLTGCYQPDPDLGADYRSFADFRQPYAVRLDELGALDSPQPTWALFGNSFVQAPGMLGDTAAAALPNQRMFYLKLNEPPNLRIAQARLLLKQGLRPERLVFALLPIDMLILGNHPLYSIQVTKRGALTYRARRPKNGLGSLIGRSRLALVPWVRSGLAAEKPSFRVYRVTSHLPKSLIADLNTFTRMLDEMQREYGCTVTMLLIPNRDQVYGEAGYALQDALAAMCREHGIDCCDTRNVFLNATDKPSLFLPDFHFSRRGNEILFSTLQDHFEAQEKTGTAGK
jgi:hypothetical protein